MPEIQHSTMQNYIRTTKLSVVWNEHVSECMRVCVCWLLIYIWTCTWWSMNVSVLVYSVYKSALYNVHIEHIFLCLFSLFIAMMCVCMLSIHWYSSREWYIIISFFRGDDKTSTPKQLLFESQLLWFLYAEIQMCRTQRKYAQFFLDTRRL